MSRLDQITLKHLRALRALEQHGSIARAADMLGLTPPAVHSQLKTIEDIIGTPLLLRHGGAPLRLSPAGQALVSAGEQIVATLNKALGQIDALENGYRGRVVLGVVSTAKYFAPRIVANLRRALPQIEVVLKVGNRSETIAALEDRAYDLCIMGRPPRAPILNWAPLADHPHVIIAAPDHPRVGQRGLNVADLMHDPFILRETGSGTRILAGRFLSDADYLGQLSLVEMSSNETIKQAVMSGLGVSLISAHTIMDERALGRLAVLDVTGTPILRKWYLLSQPDEEGMTDATAQVHDWLLANHAQFLSLSQPEHPRSQAQISGTL